MQHSSSATILGRPDHRRRRDCNVFGIDLGRPERRTKHSRDLDPESFPLVGAAPSNLKVTTVTRSLYSEAGELTDEVSAPVIRLAIDFNNNAP